MRASSAWPRDLQCSWVSGRRSPAATRNCHSTRSRPVIISVTGCSTCRRVFISMKKNGAVLRRDELDRSGADIADRLGRRDGRRAHLPRGARRHARRGRLLQHFLVAALHRAIAFEQIDAIAVRVGEDLDLDMARAGDVFFDQHVIVAEARRWPRAGTTPAPRRNPLASRQAACPCRRRPPPP